QQVDDAAIQVDPEVPDRAWATLRNAPSESARDRERDRDAYRGRSEVVPGERRHLRQVAERRLTRVGLPVGVGGEARGRVEGQTLLEAGEGLRVPGQNGLQAQHRVGYEYAEGAEHEQRDRVLDPGLFPP